jgi:hypothetical protein
VIMTMLLTLLLSLCASTRLSLSIGVIVLVLVLIIAFPRTPLALPSLRLCRLRRLSLGLCQGLRLLGALIHHIALVPRTQLDELHAKCRRQLLLRTREYRDKVGALGYDFG